MRRNKTVLIVFSLLALNACSSVSDMFTSADDTPPLEGERISILELQKTLTADVPLEKDIHIVLPQPWKNTSWPQAGGFPNHSMQNLSFSEKMPEKVWSQSIGKGSQGDIPLNTQPVIAENMVFTLDTKAKLSAFNAQTGEKLWSQDVGSKEEKEDVIAGGVAYAHSTLFVTNGYGEALALSPKDGSILWHKTLPAPSRAAPSILSGRLFISTIDSRLIALNAINGTSLWEYSGVGETAGLLGAASPAVNQNTVIAVFSSGEITALRVENGSVAWSDNLSNVHTLGGGLESLSDITAMPIIDQGKIIAMSYNNKLAAIDERTGTRVWQREIGGTRTPWIVGNMLYVISSENQLISINVLDGSIFWITELASFEDEKHKDDPVQWSAPIMAGGRLVLVGSHGHMIEVDSHDGEIIRDTKTKISVQISPAIANDMLYILGENGRLTAYR
ncbi:MAG: PQQ-binding-like beta-propeller repeat protein [Alphaproteobacteria bacterium]|nr:PQQ-binding-like beta-propeller repeat protein [Alphaproteobacteria bacterium]